MRFKESVIPKECYGVKFLQGEIVGYAPEELGKIGYFDEVGLPVEQQYAATIINPGDRGVVVSFLPSYEVTVLFDKKQAFIPEKDLVA